MLDKLTQHIEAGIDAGLHYGAQVCVSRNGETIADLAIGGAQPGTPLTRDHLLPWFSTGKPITAVAIAQQLEQGNLALDDTVAEFIPEFAQHGKEVFTLRHLLTHTAGMRAEPYDFPGDDWDTIVAKLCAMRPEPRWAAGEHAGYHPLSTWWILGEIVRRLSGMPFWRYVRAHIFEPIKMHDAWIGMSEQQFDDYAQTGRWAAVYDMTQDPPAPRPTSTRDHMVRPKPGGGACGPAHALVRFYRMLLNDGELDGARLLDADTVSQLTMPHREGLHDQTFKQPITWGLGLILDSKDQLEGPQTYGYGPYASARTFGHSGIQSSAAFADPAHGLAVAIIFNGAPGEKAHQQRMHDALGALYMDLGLD